MKHICYKVSILMVGLICSNCSDPQKVKQQLPSKENLEKKAETIIAYNRNRIPVPQLLDSIDEERTTEEQLFLGEKFFCDSLNKKLLAINIAHPISNIYLIDFRETDSTAIFKDYVGYYKDGVFHGTAKYQNAFHQESFLLEYNPQLGNVSVQIGKQKENYFSISLNDFSSLLKKNTSSLIIDESDQNFKNILDSSKHKTRGFRIDIDGLPLSEQKIIHPYDYYYEAILHKDGTIDLLKNKPPQQANSRYYNEHIINQIIPREIKARKLEPMRIFNQPINTKIQLRVVFYLKHK